jgi:succinate-semialdehyde dehydrogenase/glutarate-semialdehyde dehydrogenase
VGRLGENEQHRRVLLRRKAVHLHEKIADTFLDRFKKELENLVPGDPMNSKTTLGPLCTKRALDLVQSQIKTAVNGGAKVLLGGKRLDRLGYFLEPTILADIKPENPTYYQEFFAPVALIFRVKDEKEAIKLANYSPYGLGGSVITKDVERGKRVARQIQTGMVFIDQATWTAPDLPFGGVKNSGYGRELSDLGIGSFDQLRDGATNRVGELTLGRSSLGLYPALHVRIALDLCGMGLPI